MSFASLEFVVFIGLFFIFWFVVARGVTSRLWIICISSLFFYIWGARETAIVLLLTSIYDFSAANWISKAIGPKRLWLLIISVGANIGSLLFFKSQGSFYSSSSGGFRPSDFVIPVGISFYTFQSLSYVIDVYRGKKPAENFLHFFSYLIFFPQLVAGPIERAEKFLPQLLTLSRKPPRYFSALSLVIWGYFKKLIVADNLATFVNSAYAKPSGTIEGVFWLFIGFVFFLQLYCDLSAYSDIARGLARAMGFELTINFRSPFFSLGIRDYWHRFHISISEWFRDYLFYPLIQFAKNGSPWKKSIWGCFAIVITMVVSGLWHGLSMTFVWCGLFGAFGLIFEHLTNWPKFLETKISPRLGGLMVILITVLFHTFGILMFRAESIQQGLSIYRELFSMGIGNETSLYVSNKLVESLPWQSWFGAAVVLCFDAISANAVVYQKILDQFLVIPWLLEVVCGITMFIAILFYGRPTEFVYFQF